MNIYAKTLRICINIREYVIFFDIYAKKYKKGRSFSMAKTFAQKLNDARLMSAGIRSHLEELKSVSLSEERAAEIEALVSEMQEIDTKQERLKAELKNCTAILSEKDKTLNALIQDSKKRLKLTIPPAFWQEFGVADKK